MTGAQTSPPRIAASAEARDLELDFCAEQLSLLAVEVSIARGYVDLSNEPGLAYSVRQMKARMQAIVEVEGRLYKLLRERLRADAPAILEQGRNAAALGETALNAYWRGLAEDQKTAIDQMQRVVWRQTAVRADEDRAARGDAERLEGCVQQESEVAA